MQHEQDAVEGGLIAHCELACATFGGGSEGGDQGLQLQPQFFANGLSCHEGMKHNCFMRVSWAVVLATLSIHRKDGVEAHSTVITVTTVVHVKNALGRLYMLPVKPMHRLIAPAVLSRLGRQSHAA